MVAAVVVAAAAVVVVVVAAVVVAAAAVVVVVVAATAAVHKLQEGVYIYYFFLAKKSCFYKNMKHEKRDVISLSYIVFVYNCRNLLILKSFFHFQCEYYIEDSQYMYTQHSHV